MRVATLDHGDFVPALVEADFIHEGPNQEQSPAGRAFQVCRIGRVGHQRGIKTGAIVADDINGLGARKGRCHVEHPLAVRRFTPALFGRREENLAVALA